MLSDNGDSFSARQREKRLHSHALPLPPTRRAGSARQRRIVRFLPLTAYAPAQGDVTAMLSRLVAVEAENASL